MKTVVTSTFFVPVISAPLPPLAQAMPVPGDQPAVSLKTRESVVVYVAEHVCR